MSTNTKNTYTDVVKGGAIQGVHNAAEAMNYEDMKTFFASPKNFRSFGETVLFYMVWEEAGGAAPYTRFCGLANGKGINTKNICSDRTFRNWFGESRPKNRETVFKIAYVLGLDYDTTKEFMQKALFQRGFDSRSIADVVFYYGLKRGKTYSDVVALYKKAKKAKNQEKAPNETKSIHSTRLENLLEERLFTQDNDAAVLAYCASLDGKNERLKGKVAELLSADGVFALARKERDEQKKTLEALLGGEKNLPEYKSEQDDVGDNRLLEILVGYSGFDRRNPMKDNALLKLITANFPSSADVANMRNCKENDAVKLRKSLILFASYQYWRTNTFSGKKCSKCNTFYYAVGDNTACPQCHSGSLNIGYTEEGVLAEYEKHMNDLLESCGVQPLYAGDPYDLLFLICSVPDISTPTEKFRWILDAALQDEERARKTWKAAEKAGKAPKGKGKAPKAKSDASPSQSEASESDYTELFAKAITDVIYNGYTIPKKNKTIPAAKIQEAVFGNFDETKKLSKAYAQFWAQVAKETKLNEWTAEYNSEKRAKMSTYLVNKVKRWFVGDVYVLLDRDNLDYVFDLPAISADSDDAPLDIKDIVADETAEKAYSDAEWRIDSVPYITALDKYLSEEDKYLWELRVDDNSDMAEIQRKFREKFDKECDEEDLRRMEARAFRLFSVVRRKKEAN